MSTGQLRQGLVGDESSAQEEEQSRTVALKQLQFVSVSWGLWKEEAPWQTPGRAHPWEADKGRKGPRAEGLVDSQCRGFNTGKSSVVLGQGVVQEV